MLGRWPFGGPATPVRGRKRSPFLLKHLRPSWEPILQVDPTMITLPETNIAHENPIFLGKYHQNGGFSMAMLVYRRVFPRHPKSSKYLIRRCEIESLKAFHLRRCGRGVQTPILTRWPWMSIGIVNKTFSKHFHRQQVPTAKKEDINLSISHVLNLGKTS